MVKVFKSQLIELVLAGVPGGNTSTKLQFLDQPYLRGKSIHAIELITKGDMVASSASPTGKAIFDISASSTPLATGGPAYLTLYLNDAQNPNNVGEWIQNVPFPLLHRVQNSATPVDSFVRAGYQLAGQVIYWEKCYVTFPRAIQNTADLSILLNVYFQG